VDHIKRLAGVAAAVAKLSARTLVLDGEVAIYDQQLRSRFEWLREPDRDAVASPPLLMVCDLLYHDRRDLTGRPAATSPARPAGGRRGRKRPDVPGAAAGRERAGGVVVQVDQRAARPRGNGVGGGKSATRRTPKLAIIIQFGPPGSSQRS
jgi:hypothetical protein